MSKEAKLLKRTAKSAYEKIHMNLENAFVALFTKGLDRSSEQLDYINNMIEIFERYYTVKF